MIIDSKDVYLRDHTPFEDDYSWGICNGLELALCLLEERPGFLVDKEKRHSEYDINRYPEYFL